MNNREPYNNGKRKKPLKPLFKSTWSAEKLYNVLLEECYKYISENNNNNKDYYSIWSFSRENISRKYNTKPKIAEHAIFMLRTRPPKGYYIGTINSAPHESSRNRFFWHGPNKSGWRATFYCLMERERDEEIKEIENDE